MKKNLLLLAILSGLALSGCDALEGFFATKESNSPAVSSEDKKDDDSSPSLNSSNQNSSNDENNNNNVPKEDENTNTDEDITENPPHEDPPPNPPINEDEEEVEDERYIAIPTRTLDLKINGQYSLIVDFFPSNSFSDDEKAGVWASSNESVATVSKYGVVKGVSEGKAVITYTTTVDHYVASMVVYVAEKEIHREYIKVDDVDSIKPGDELIFACPEFGVAASINKKSYWVDVTPISFKENNTKLTSVSDDVASFIVGESQESSDAFTLETQDGKFLAAKQTTIHRSLYYFKTDKAQIDWIAETPQGYSENYVVNYNLRNDYWLMFNKINNEDIRFNIYDSSEQSLMKKPIIYRNTVIH